MSELREGCLYLAGPMSGIADHNFPTFHAEAAGLRAMGYKVLNPAENGADGTYEECLRRALIFLLQCSAVVVLPGWTRSRGARLEVEIADALGMPVLDSQTMALAMRWEPLLSGTAPG